MLLPVELGETGSAIETDIRALGSKLLGLIGERGEARAVNAGTEIEGSASGEVLFLRDGYLQELRGESDEPLYTYSPGDVISLSATVRDGASVRLASDFAAEVVVFQNETFSKVLREIDGALELWLELSRVQREMLEHVCLRLGAAQERPRLRFARFEEGAVIIEEGAEADSVYELMNGEASVWVGDQEVDSVLRGQIFGEMSFLLDRPRAATVRAKTPCDVQITVRDDFLKMIQSRPRLLADIARGLATRVTQLDAKLVAP